MGVVGWVLLETGKDTAKTSGKQDFLLLLLFYKLTAVAAGE